MLSIILIILLIAAVWYSYKLKSQLNDLQYLYNELEQVNKSTMSSYDSIREANTRLRLEVNASKKVADDVIIQETARKERIANPYQINIDKIKSMQNNIGGM